MSYFLSGQPLHAGLEFVFEGEDARHLLASRRTRAGERFELQDPQGQRFLAEVISAERRAARVRVLEPLPLPAPPQVELWLFQAAVKDKAEELIVQKGAELGVAEIVFFPAGHSTVAHRALQNPANPRRWERIAWEACKQSGRAAPPGIRVVEHLSAALKLAANLGPGNGFLLQADSPRTLAETIRESRSPGSLRLLVGPEGGWAEEELRQIQQEGWIPTRLGSNVLRAETAALAACSVALFCETRPSG